MSVTHMPRHGSPSTGRPAGRLARWSVGLSAVSAATFAAASATVAVAYTIGGESVIEDTWLGASLAGAAFIGLLGSLVALVAAVAARVRGERRVPLWLPLSVFPACLLFLILGEAFWWE